MQIKHNKLIVIIILSFVMVFQGCATVPKEGGYEESRIDPLEKINRISYNITDSIDRTIFEPVVDVYIDYVPDAAQRSIGNFYDNLSYPNVIINTFLQGKFRQGLGDGLRFIVNSTIGMFGLFDMATHMGLEEHDEDFGQTLGVWGLDTGAYIFVPFLGPSNNRDLTSIPVTVVTNVLFYAGYAVGVTVLGPLTILGAIDRRARLSGPMRIRDQAALDPYLFVREASLQQREYLVYDGNPPLDVYNEPFQDNPFEVDSNEQTSN